MKIKLNQDIKELIIKDGIKTLIYLIIFISSVFPNEGQFIFTGFSDSHATISLQSSIEIEEEI
ncbi:uncharacterized protein METZ01_LOCUS287223, partial [marine metagenome]